MNLTDDEKNILRAKIDQVVALLQEVTSAVDSKSNSRNFTQAVDQAVDEIQECWRDLDPNAWYED